ncbi:ThiF family adenylyltransferase [Curtobacterium sp. VKM Ac-2922]|uniref:ThiF family adenylyltransferase n=1 Tax=Curtobacterium sp. VKM Ac-2922 TaxID=2929475 RepID=UPI001FB215DF|nr:ThiF family adenylyltransferase [Curtobacterium sp. VKM Ac-2922]MCJ1712641.1 ThiF family adenylyltransferase [Curtobacterium sp. VKM Ac-2922]
MMMYRLRPGWFRRHEGDHCVVFFDEDREITVTGAVVDAVDSPRPGLFTARTNGQARFLAELRRRGALVPHDPCDATTDASAAPQAEYFAAFCDDPQAAQQALERSRFIVLGLGGTGAEFLRLVAAAGVRRFVLVDADVVEESNSNRQTIYQRSDIGLPKAEAAARYLEARYATVETISLHTRVRGDQALRDMLVAHAPDLVFIAVDEPIDTIVSELAAELRALQVPFLVAGVGIRHGHVHAVSDAPAADTTLLPTRASIATTNTMVAACAAHAAIEHVTSLHLPFDLKRP